MAITQLDKLFKALRHLPRALVLVWDATRGWTAAWAVILLVQGLLPAAKVYLIKPLIDSLIAAVNSGGSSEAWGTVVWWGGIMAAVMILNEVLWEAIGLVRTYQTELLHDYISTLIYRKSISADFAFYDLPEYYDHLHRARTDAIYRPEALLESLGSLAQNAITLLAIGVVIISYGWWLPLILIAGALPALLAALYWTGRHYAWRKRVTADERRIWYYDWLLTSNETAAEIRLFNLGDHFQSLWRNLRQRLRGELFRMTWQQSLTELAATLLAMVVVVAVLGYMAWQVVRGAATLGVLALFYQSLNQGAQLLQSLLNNIGRLYANVLFLGNLFEFLGLKPEIRDPAEASSPPQVLRQGIVFDRVSFAYPGSEREVLSNFSLELPAGKVIAIVGLNGAGKTTLFKLLCRLYDVKEGRITIDGIDLRQFKLDDLRKMITVLFQSPVHYNQTARENIVMGDLIPNHEMGEIETAAQAAGADEIIRKLPDGYEHQLGKWFENGTELSTGEWQRLALARAFLRQAPIMLLDEPTSAMDSWAEADWMSRFRDLTAGRTSIIITHRFTTAMQADIVHVMVGGHLLESGTHEKLIALGGFYATSWTAQSRK